MHKFILPLVLLAGFGLFCAAVPVLGPASAVLGRGWADACFVLVLWLVMAGLLVWSLVGLWRWHKKFHAWVIAEATKGRGPS